MKKIYFISLPFDRENSGDYGYCTKMFKTINDVRYNNYTAEYVTFDLVKENDKTGIIEKNKKEIYKIHKEEVLDNKDISNKFIQGLNKFHEHETVTNSRSS